MTFLNVGKLIVLVIFWGEIAFLTMSLRTDAGNKRSMKKKKKKNTVPWWSQKQKKLLGTKGGSWRLKITIYEKKFSPGPGFEPESSALRAGDITTLREFFLLNY